MRKLEIHKAHPKAAIPLPLFLSEVPAGFPSPSEGEIDSTIDLNELLIKKPAATFYVRVQGDSMQDAHIFSGDVLIIDRSLEPKHRDVILAILDGEFTVKRFLKKDGKMFLAAENKRYSSIEITSDRDFQVWGVVTYVIHKAR